MQLRRLGRSDGSIEKAVHAGRLHLVFRGVYAVGRPGIGERGRMMGAVLACGHGTVISHRSAAALLGLVDRTVDLAGVVGKPTLRGVFEVAAYKRLLDLHGIDATLGRGRRRGAPTLRTVLAEWRAAATVATTQSLPTFDRDRWRDRELLRAGYTTLRVPWRHAEDEPDAVLEAIRTRLTHRNPTKWPVGAARSDGAGHTHLPA